MAESQNWTVIGNFLMDPADSTTAKGNPLGEDRRFGIYLIGPKRGTMFTTNPALRVAISTSETFMPLG
jgi:hypothetical protein